MDGSTRREKIAAAGLIVMFLAMFGGIAGCAVSKPGKAGDTGTRTIWSLHDQFVAIDKQEGSKGAAAISNSHPAAISDDRLDSALDSIEVRSPGQDRAVSLFNVPELKILSEKIREGLAAAGPDEDVTFAVIGQYTTLLGIFKERKVTTGRVFCQDGQLNIIFGDVLRDVKENEDRRLYPFLKGSRGAAAPLASALAAKPGHETFGVKRPDWVVFPLMPPAVPVATPAPREGGRTGTTGKTISPAPSTGKNATPAGKTIEERLRILNELQRQQLVTEGEYRTKRREILNEL